MTVMVFGGPDALLRPLRHLANLVYRRCWPLLDSSPDSSPESCGGGPNNCERETCRARAKRATVLPSAPWPRFSKTLMSVKWTPLIACSSRRLRPRSSRHHFRPGNKDPRPDRPPLLFPALTRANISERRQTITNATKRRTLCPVIPPIQFTLTHTDKY